MARILVVDDSPMVAQLVKLTLSRGGHEVQTAENGIEGVAKAKEWRPDIIIMDVMMPELDGYGATRQIRQQPETAMTPILILTAQDTLTEKMSGFEAGADDYLTKPFEPLELQMRVEAHLKRAAALAAAAAAATAAVPPAAKAGFLTACFSLRGGAGVSILAANLSVALAQIWGRPSILMDLALTAGHSALLLNVPLKRSWADLAATNADDVDAELVEQHLVEHASGVKLLPSPLRSIDGDLVTAEHVSAALKILQGAYDYLVADLPHDFDDITLLTLEAADQVLIPFAPDLASVRSVAAAVEVLQSLDYPREQIKLILNWVFPKAGLPQADIEKALNLKVDVVLPYDAENLVRSINMGRPLTTGAVTSPLGMALEDYAFRLSRPEDRDSPPDAPSETWQRVAKRTVKSAGLLRR